MSGRHGSTGAGVSRAAFSLVELLIVAAIIIVLAAIILPRYFGGHSRPGQPTPKSAMGQAHDTECIYNLRSVRQCIEATRSTDEDNKFPASLTELREIGPELRRCPVGHEGYVYDPQTGQVYCPHPGHEKY